MGLLSIGTFLPIFRIQDRIDLNICFEIFFLLSHAIVKFYHVNLVVQQFIYWFPLSTKAKFLYLSDPIGIY